MIKQIPYQLINDDVKLFSIFKTNFGTNSYSPEFSEKFPLLIKVREDARVGTELVTVKVRDLDQGYNGKVVYSISGGNRNNAFIIGTESGVVEIRTDLDHELQTEYVLNVTAYDLGAPRKSSSHNITIQIIDVNDNAPKFSQEFYRLELLESTDIGSTVLQIYAEDLDEDIFLSIQYELVTEVSHFFLDKFTGELIVNETLDREKNTKYDLLVRAQDSPLTQEQMFSYAHVYITITDINDCKPDFGINSRVTVSISEDLPVGTVVASLAATDKDQGNNGKVTYHLDSESTKIFRVDPLTGVIRVAQKLDYESQSFYNITIKATDGGEPALHSEASLLITVLDVDENLGPPVFSKRLLHSQVKENLPPGALVTTLKAHDPYTDGAPLTYTITAGTGLGYFTINDKGEVRTLRVLDRETSRGYWLTVVVADVETMPLTDICQVYVEVDDVNDHIPQTLLPAYHIKVSEDAKPGGPLMQLQALDGDLTPTNITFMFTRGNHKKTFFINQTTGLISLVRQLDREIRSLYHISVTLSDGHLTSVTPVTITITDVNDHPPHFMEPLYRITVPARISSRRRKQLFKGLEIEDEYFSQSSEFLLDQNFTVDPITAFDDAPLFGVFAIDDDIGPNASLNYSITSSRGKAFKIHNYTGLVYTSRELQAGKTFEFKIQATDNGSPSLSTTTRVLLRVVDIPSNSSNPPMIDPLLPVQIMESDLPGRVVTYIHATDDDDDSLWYYITDGDDEGQFSIGVDTGILSLSRPVDHETQSQYVLQIAVIDGFHSAIEQLVIEVLDANDHQPELSHSEYWGNVSESAIIGTTVLSLHCQDYDTGRSRLFFSIHHSNATQSTGLFALNSSTGALTVAKPLDRELSGIHQLTVSCRDRSHREQTDLARITVTIEDDNEHDPVFLEKIILANVNVGAAAGTVVTKVKAFDRDTSDNGRLSYSITEGNRDGIFTIDETLGWIRLAHPLPKNATSEFLLLVSAADHCKFPHIASVSVKISVNYNVDETPIWDDIDIPSVVEVSEWTLVNTAIAQVSASASTSLYYSITHGNQQSTFRVSPVSGIVILATELDYEENSFFNITIESRTNTAFSISRWLVVHVLDENDWWPEWDELHYSGYIQEDADFGDPVIDFSSPIGRPTPLTVTATDLDHQGQNGLISYSIIEKNTTRYFSINPHTGAIRVSGPLHDIAGENISFSIWAMDGGEPRRECLKPVIVNINVLKVEKTEITFSNDNYATVLYLPEFPIYTLIQVLCIEVNVTSNKDVIYEIIDGDIEAKYSFDSFDQCLYIKDKHNIEQEYLLTLQGSVGDLNATTTISIDVKDAPTSTLVFTREKYFANVWENSTEKENLDIINIKNLPINHHIKYSILNPVSNFEIHSTAGVVMTTGEPFDREKQDYFAILIKAQDIEKPDNFAFVLLHVAVIDVNDNSPIFFNQPYYFLVTTKADVKQTVAQIRAEDFDAGKYGTVRYEIQTEGIKEFSINEETGEIILEEPQTKEDKTYNITVSAFDGGNPSYVTKANVIIRVVSAEGPMFSSVSYKSTIPEDIPIGSAVARVEAHSPSNLPLIYTIIDGNKDELFSLDYQTGVLLTATLLDFELQPEHYLTVQAREPISKLSACVQVSVTLEDVNDNSPEFQDSLVKVRVSEAEPVGHMFIQVSTTDQDSGYGGKVRYFCITNCDLFAVGSEDGRIKLKGKLDAEQERHHTITVMARDLGLPSKSSETEIVVEVTDLNDNSPIWEYEEYHCIHSPDAVSGHIVTSMIAYDADISQMEALEYRIHSGNPYGIFKMCEGVLSVIAPHKLQKSCMLNISASDGVHIAFTSLRVSVLTSNKMGPRFEKNIFEVFVSEEVSPGYFIIDIAANITDSSSISSYKIVHQTVEKTFRIDSDGKVYTYLTLDREDIAMHIVKVSVTDNKGRSDFTKIHIAIKDENDNGPLFKLNQYQGNIPINTPKTSRILMVEATDPDEGQNGKIHYRIYNHNTQNVENLFKVHPNTGIITLNKDFLEGEEGSYQFFIRAEDNGIPKKRKDVPVTILVLSNSAIFPKSTKYFEQFFLSEDAYIGWLVTSFWNNGPEEVQYSILSQSNKQDANDKGELFAITHSGMLVIQQPLDYEIVRVHEIIIANQTISTPHILDYITISIVVMDVNDNQPTFLSPSYEAFIAEDSEEGSTVLMLTANDKDSGINGKVHYSILIDSDDPQVLSTFKINTHNGVITLISSLDWEMRDFYSFTVVARDSGSPSLTESTRVTVHVKDANDNPPVFLKDLYVTSVAENATVGTVLITLEVSDADEQFEILDYFITGGNNQGHFKVHDSGEIYVAQPLDREQQDEYTLTISANDGKFIAETIVSISITDINDNGPICNVPIYQCTISEGADNGTHVQTVSAFDPDIGIGAKIRYTLNDGDYNYFAIDNSKGTISTSKFLDREKNERITIYVTAEDWEYSDWYCQMMVVVDIEDINDNAPLFSNKTFNAMVPEDVHIQSVIFKMESIDPDVGINHKVMYTLLDSADNHFIIDSTEGFVSLAKPLDREKRDFYSITVKASDLGTPSLSSTAIVSVIVLDINDNAPEFEYRIQQTTIPENTPMGTEIMTVLATSRDIGINAEITYTIEHTTAEKYFEIDSKTGIITIGRGLDYEEVRQVIATVTATDGGTPALSSTAVVNITVQDINDNAPIFSQSSYTLYIEENSAASRSVLELTANDIDSGMNGEVQYSILNDHSYLPFEIDNDLGVLTLIEILDREKIEEYVLEIKARDGGVPANSQTTKVIVTVEDVNDCPPVFTSNDYKIVVQENQPIGYSILKMEVNDDDASSNGAPFTWELTGQSSGEKSWFSIDQNGIIHLKTSELNHYIEDEYKLEIQVWDNGIPPLSATTEVFLTIVEESRFPPTVFPLTAYVLHYKTPYPGGLLGQITALDQDFYDTLEYSFLNNNIISNYINDFSIDSKNGTLTALKPLDTGNYEIDVVVSDGKYESSGNAVVKVNIMDELTLSNAVILNMESISPSEFLSDLQEKFIYVLSTLLKTNKNLVSVLGIQTSQTLLNTTKNKSRRRRGINESLEILIAAQNMNMTYYKKRDLIYLFEKHKNAIQESLNLNDFSFKRSMCNNEARCNGNGICRDSITFDNNLPGHYITQLISMVSPHFAQSFSCQCIQGLTGHVCNEIVNVCGRRPCASYQECTPSITNPQGYTCHCPEGYFGPTCQVDISNCHYPTCFYPLQPLSFKGMSYAQYSIPYKNQSSSTHIKLYFRTRYPAGIIIYLSGVVDYGILEMFDGYIQYRWDCGSGEGKVRISEMKVDDGDWHFISLTQKGTISWLTVDNTVKTGMSYGIKSILNIDSNYIYIGAEVIREIDENQHIHVSVRKGFVGCMEQIYIDENKLPLALTGTSIYGSTLKKLENVDMQCSDSLLFPGMCGSYPCLNGGTCIEGIYQSFKCLCSARYKGSKCQIDTAPCSSSPCLNGGHCVVTGHSYTCKCPSKLNGRRCEYGIHCNPNPCQNGGYCEEGKYGPICKCRHYAGNTCEEDIDECTLFSPCQNSGTCLNLLGSFRCICKENVTGEYCNAMLRSTSLQSRFIMRLETLLCIIAILIFFLVAAMILVVCLKKKWKKKEMEQNNIRLTEINVKKDLKTIDITRNKSKLCNVEAEEVVPPLPPRPNSYGSATADAALLNTLKQLAQYSSHNHENTDYTALNRGENTDTAAQRKTWDYQNNLNKVYFKPMKDIELPLPPKNTNEGSTSNARAVANTDQLTDGNNRRSSPPIIPPLPLHIMKSRRKAAREAKMACPQQQQSSSIDTEQNLNQEDYSLEGSNLHPLNVFDTTKGENEIDIQTAYTPQNINDLNILASAITGNSEICPIEDEEIYDHHNFEDASLEDLLADKGSQNKKMKSRTSNYENLPFYTISHSPLLSHRISHKNTFTSSCPEISFDSRISCDEIDKNNDSIFEPFFCSNKTSNKENIPRPKSLNLQAVYVKHLRRSLSLSVLDKIPDRTKFLYPRFIQTSKSEIFL
ncbi:unnamed protein product, partial [Meganyctiphanes norvegica]